MSTLCFAPTRPGHRRQCVKGSKQGLKTGAERRQAKNDRARRAEVGCRQWTLGSASWTQRSIFHLSRPMLGSSTSATTTVAVTAKLAVRCGCGCGCGYDDIDAMAESHALNPSSLTASLTHVSSSTLLVLTAPPRSKLGIDPSTIAAL